MRGNLQNALWLLSLSSPDTWDRVTKAGGCDTRAAGSRSFTTIYISLVSLLGLYRVGFLTQRSKGRSDNPDVHHLAWRSRALHPIRSTNTPMSRRSEKIISNWEEVCKGIHFIGIFCSHKQARPEVRHGLLRAGCSFWHIVFFPARALRALGLLLADGTPTVGGGKTFWAVSRIFLRKQL